MKFELDCDYKPAGDQPKAIKALVKSLRAGTKYQTLHGVTGTGKTFTMANIVETVQRPTLAMVHNKVLAKQLYDEFTEFFPRNAVHLFVSTFETYQPEAYDARRNVYIKKDGLVDKDLYKHRLATLDALLSRRDVLVVASASAVFGLSPAADYRMMSVHLRVGDKLKRNALLDHLIAIEYARDDLLFLPGKFRLRGDSVDVYRPFGQRAWRITFQGERVDRLAIIDPVHGDVVEDLDEITIRPAATFVLPPERIAPGIEAIERELPEQLEQLRSQGDRRAAERLDEIVSRDIQMLRHTGSCLGIENYVRAFSGREPDATPATLFDYFDKDFLLFVDESHATISQIANMHAGNEVVKQGLIKAGWRLPSALDQRPLRFDEWEKAINQVIFVSATPGPYELNKSAGAVVKQIMRPTGLLDPIVEVHAKQDCLAHLIEQVRERVTAGQQVLATTIKKRWAEILAASLKEAEIKCGWLHCDLTVRQRTDLLRAFRKGRFERPGRRELAPRGLEPAGRVARGHLGRR